MVKRIAGFGLAVLLTTSAGWAGEAESERRPVEVTQGNVKVLGDAPPVAQSNEYQSGFSMTGAEVQNSAMEQQDSMASETEVSLDS